MPSDLGFTVASRSGPSDESNRAITPLVSILAMYAVIASGGKQEKVAEGQRVQLELLGADEGSDVSLTPVMVVDGSTVLATPDELKSASVTGKIIGQVKGPKINGYTYKRRTNQHRRYGHRQKYHLVEITSITV